MLRQESNYNNVRKSIREEQNERSLKNDASNRIQNVSNMTKSSKFHEKTSNLASELISKGLYNVANVANLMNNKKYKLTKEKEESFQMAIKRKQKINSLKLEQPK